MADILAVIARVGWQRIDDDADLKRAVMLAPAGDYIIQALIENPPADRSIVHDAFLLGIKNGSAAFHETEHRTAMKALAPIRSRGFTDLPETRLLFLDFSVTRSDVKRFNFMSPIDMNRAALTSLMSLRISLASDANLLSLAWSPGIGAGSFAELAAETQQREALGEPRFPARLFPELSRFMEIWDLESASPDPSKPSNRLRI